MSAVTTGRTVDVRVPATSANLGPGFDTLGLALALYDELTVEAAPAGVLEIEVEGVGADDVPRDASHLVVRAIAHALADFGYDMPGLRIHARNSIPHGRGLGSSGAAIVSGIMAAVGLVADQREIGSDDILRLATELEGHPDNVAPCIFGGLTIAWVSTDGSPHSKQLLVHRGISPIVLIPVETMSTQLARSLQPAQVPHADAIFNVSRSALLIAALVQSPEVLLEATEDRLHQNYRASAMPKTAGLIERLRAEGLPAVVSGAGPSILVLCENPAQRLVAARIAEQDTSTTWRAIMPAVDVLGATVVARSAETVLPSA
ncbi:homoserine kinase [Pseudoclavibacter chungangensis]|uniref:Homoserine kinase n=1 Tax=Pseudoclavibacter chungangensis TaxID=587635 RepID=A0A7J5BSP0_9MICO|nr:homoserine kinase [Pseudoclavibacter chungangensis]KAB1657327.1 homoserine kinase [Pseudoclavibacter chungangensis]NYJ66219.1 homoserine kinase [Pseudoclavibacter chungangensis]